VADAILKGAVVWSRGGGRCGVAPRDEEVGEGPGLTGRWRAALNRGEVGADRWPRYSPEWRGVKTV
jgi:hypothetical protein